MVCRMNQLRTPEPFGYQFISPLIVKLYRKQHYILLLGTATNFLSVKKMEFWGLLH